MARQILVIVILVIDSVSVIVELGMVNMILF